MSLIYIKYVYVKFSVEIAVKNHKFYKKPKLKFLTLLLFAAKQCKVLKVLDGSQSTTEAEIILIFVFFLAGFGG